MKREKEKEEGRKKVRREERKKEKEKEERRKVRRLLRGYVWARAAYPRYRYDQLMRLGWKVRRPVARGLTRRRRKGEERRRKTK